MLSYNELCELVEQGVITPVNMDAVNASSIDVHLGERVIVEILDNAEHPINIMERNRFPNAEFNIKGHYDMAPGEFILAHTIEQFNLPMDISADFRLKSSGARSGLNNLFACHCDAGWHGSSLTLELHNVLRFHTLRLTPGMPIGQMIFHRHVPVPQDKSYATRGRYNNDRHVRHIKA